MRLAFFTDPAYAGSTRKILEKFADDIDFIYVFERSDNTEVEYAFYLFNQEKDHSYYFLREYGIDIVLVYGWNHRIPVERYADIPFYNIHPSLLPRYRGPDPITFQILCKEERLGVTLHKMDIGLDSGPIYSQKEFKLNYDGELNSIFFRFTCCVHQILNDFLRDLINSNIKLKSQPEEEANYYSYRDLDRFIIRSSMQYNDFLRICRVFQGRYPVKVVYNETVCGLAAYSLEQDRNYLPFSLADKQIYIKTYKLKGDLFYGDYNH